MKKLALIIAIVLGSSLTIFANPNGGGLFQRGDTPEQTRNANMPSLPNHGETGNQDAPLSTGIAVLIGLGAVYAVTKKRPEE